MKQNPGMPGLHQRHSLNVKEVLLKLVWEAANLKFFNQLFQEGLERGARRNKSKSRFCLHKHFHCAGFEAQELVGAGPWAIPSCQMLKAHQSQQLLKKSSKGNRGTKGWCPGAFHIKGFAPPPALNQMLLRPPPRFLINLDSSSMRTLINIQSIHT